MASPLLKPKMIVRIVVGVALVTVLVIALLDYKSKNDAQKTTDAWVELMQRGDSDAVLLEELEDKIVGDPVVQDTENDTDGETYKDYIWQGTFRSYRTRVLVLTTTEYVGSVEGPFNE